MLPLDSVSRNNCNHFHCYVDKTLKFYLFMKAGDTITEPTGVPNRHVSLDGITLASNNTARNLWYIQIFFHIFFSVHTKDIYRTTYNDWTPVNNHYSLAQKLPEKVFIWSRCYGWADVGFSSWSLFLSLSALPPYVHSRSVLSFFCSSFLIHASPRSSTDNIYALKTEGLTLISPASPLSTNPLTTPKVLCLPASSPS